MASYTESEGVEERQREREKEVEATLALATAAIVQSQLMVAGTNKFYSDRIKENCYTGIVPSSLPISRLRVRPVVWFDSHDRGDSGSRPHR